MAYYQNSPSFIPYQHFTALDMNFGGGSMELSHRISENFSMKDIALENFMASQQPAAFPAASSLTCGHHPVQLERLEAVPVTHSVSSSSTASPQGRKRKVNEQQERSSTTVTGLTGSTGITKKRIESRKGKKRSIDKEFASNPEEVIHVRSRRGQATDSHSLSERVRREKINSKLRCLQEIVPGCCKKMGMALMLEEIINYVYSLQNQVEFLSMELAAASTTSLYESNMGTGTHGIGIEQRKKTEKLQYGEHAHFQWTGSI